MKNITLNKVLVWSGLVALVFVVTFFVWWNKEIVISKGGFADSETQGLASLITGLECNKALRRPVAVMLAGDLEARPLSGISQADIVFEMPVAPNGITRYMAVYQCEEPEEIGSVRSAREDFIPLAAAMKAVYAHWGGEHGALTKLNNKILDNIDAMKYETTAFFRKKTIPMPHNGFTDLDLIKKKSEDLSYGLVNEFEGYLSKTEKIEKRNLGNIANSIEVDYKKPFNVSWSFDSENNIYKRNRNGTPEIDKNNSEQVSASVVIVMETKSTFVRDQYIRVSVQGEGTAYIYQGGTVITGKWKKDPAKLDSRLIFYDSEGKEAKLLPGKIWVEITTDQF